MKKKQTRAGDWARQLALPPEGYGGAGRITLSGNGHVLVEGQRGLEEYEPGRMAVALRRGRVILRGENLRLEAMSAGELSVSGRFWAVELE